MSDLEKVLSEVLSEIKPTPSERARALEIFENVKTLIENSLKIPYEYSIELHGSVAKGTELRGDIDLDVFVLIRYEGINEDWLRDHVVLPLYEVFSRVYGSTRLKYATHPYINIKVDSYEVDIVPAYWARDIREIRTAVDRTPFHTRYVASRLNERSRDEVRLLKSFLKGIGVYGAEIRVEGFSGYLAELLVIKYGNFIEVLRSATSWRYGEVIVVEGEADNPTVSRLRKVFKAPLVVVDPVDTRRNAASAVSAESLARFVVASHMFLRNPSTSFFKIPRSEQSAVKAVGQLRQVVETTDRELLGVVFGVARGTPPDVIWGKLRSLVRSLLNLLRKYGFTNVSYLVWSDEESEALLLVSVLPRELPRYEVHGGPPLGKYSDIAAFIEENSRRAGTLGPYVDPEGRPFFLVPRRFRYPHQVVENYVSSLRDLAVLYPIRILRNVVEVESYVTQRGSSELVKALERIVLLKIP
jgi:tRNA nucleotidyltransferase (CCA-adding enzyme)